MHIHWTEQTAADVPAGDDWLSANESAVLSCLRFPKRRADWRLGRWTAKLAVAAYLNRPAGEQANIEIRAAASGAPEVFIAGVPAPVTISLSHRAGVAACALAGPATALGCDIELVEPRSPAFAADYFTAAEQALIAARSMADRPGLLALLWSAKESVLKALREGLRLDPRAVMVTPTAALLASDYNQWHPLEARYQSQIFHGWWSRSGLLVRTLVS